MTSTVTYTGGLRTEAVHVKSSMSIITDAPIDNQGKGEAFSPTDLVATALASCILTIMGIAARNHQIDMEGSVAEVTKTMASDPRRISQIEVVVKMPSNNYTAKEIRILEAAAHGCPVGRSLHPDLKEVIKIEWPKNKNI